MGLRKPWNRCRNQVSNARTLPVIGAGDTPHKRIGETALGGHSAGESPLQARKPNGLGSLSGEMKRRAFGRT